MIWLFRNRRRIRREREQEERRRLEEAIGELIKENIEFDNRIHNLEHQVWELRLRIGELYGIQENE